MKKNIIITGAGGNLGKAAVERFLIEGYRVIATVSPGKSIGYETKGDVVVYPLDLTDEAKVEEFVTTVIKTYTVIDTALLLVGAFSPGGIKETNGASLRKMIALNFDTAYFVARHLFRQMMAQSDGGRIILIGARPAIHPAEGKDAIGYGLSKAMLFTLAEFLNAEGEKANVITSVVVPGVIDTLANRSSNPHADRTAWVTPEAIAEIICFISSAKGTPIAEPVIKIYGNHK